MFRSWFGLFVLVSACSGGASSTSSPAGGLGALPANLTATAANGKVSLAWTPVDGAISYPIFRQASTEGSSSQIASAPINSFVDTAVKNGQTYRYTVSALTAAGTSRESAEASATPSRVLCVTDLFNDRIQLLGADVDAAVQPPPGFGSATGLRPFDIDVDPVHREIFSANGNTVTAHAATINGNALPLRTMSAPTGADAVAYDAASDTLLIADNVGAIFTVPRSATSDTPPVRQLNTHAQTTKLATSGPAHGDRLFVVPFNTNRILVHARTDAGEAAPAATIVSPSDLVAGIAYDPVTDQILAAVGSRSGVAVQAFPASGSTSAPARVLAGDQTMLGNVAALALDAGNRRLYLADNGRILVFSADFAATANVAPSQILAGPSTQFAGLSVGKMVIDPARNVLLVQVGTRVLTFAANASGDTAPLSAISSVSSGVERPIGIAFDPDRKEILVANSGPQPTLSAFPASALPAIPAVSRILALPTGTFVFRPGVAVDATHGEIFAYASFPPVIQVYRRGASGNDPPLRSIGGGSDILEDIAYDSANDALVVNVNNDTIRRFARTAQGEVAPLTSLTVPDGVPALAVDNRHGELFAAVPSGVAVYHLTDSGQAAPIRTLSGLNGVQGLMVDEGNDELYVISDFGGAIHVYARAASGNAAPLRSPVQTGVSNFAIEAFHLALCN